MPLPKPGQLLGKVLSGALVLLRRQLRAALRLALHELRAAKRLVRGLREHRDKEDAASLALATAAEGEDVGWLLDVFDDVDATRRDEGQQELKEVPL